MQKISPFLWFDNNAEAAARFYTSVFKTAKIIHTARYPEGSPGLAGSVMTIEFELFGQTFTALNGGPLFKFNESISFVVNCATQREVDYYWTKLSAGGKKSRCGWLQDKFGLWWQIVPVAMNEWFSSKDPARSSRVMQAMLKMSKLDLKVLAKAVKGDGVPRTGGARKRK